MYRADQLHHLIAVGSVLPIIGAMLFLGVTLCAPRLLRAAVLASLVALAAVPAAVPLRLSLVSMEANIPASLAVALLYCFLAASTWAVRPPALRAGAVLAAYTPVIAAYAAFASYRLVVTAAVMCLTAELPKVFA